MIIANGEHVSTIRHILEGKNVGTLFCAHKNKDFNLLDYLYTNQYHKEEWQHFKLQRLGLQLTDGKE